MVETYPRFPFPDGATEDEEQPSINIHESDKGTEQRRDRWAGKTKRIISFQYENLTQDEEEFLWRFYQNHRGAARTFQCASANRDTALTAKYGLSTVLSVESTHRFSGIDEAYGNKVLLFNNYENIAISSPTASYGQVQVVANTLIGTTSDDYWKGMIAIPNTGANIGLWRPISKYVDASGTFTFAWPFPVALTNADTFNVQFWEVGSIKNANESGNSHNFHYTATASGGAVGYITDATNIIKTTFTVSDNYIGGIVEMTSGENSFQKRQIINIDTAAHKIYVYPDFENAVEANDTYIVMAANTITLLSNLQMNDTAYTYASGSYVEAVLPKCRFLDTSQSRSIFGRELRSRGVQIIQVL